MNKVCSKCGIEKPATPEFFHRDSTRPSGFHPHCKLCVAQKHRVYYAANRERKREHHAAYRAANRGKMQKNSRVYYAANRENRREYHAAYRATNRENRREYSAAYRAANPFAVRAASAIRRARKRQATGSYTKGDTQEQYKRQKGKCYYCQTKVGDTYHVDHVVPLSRGGTNGVENIVIACPSCNQSKKDKMPHEWPQGGRLL